MLNHYMYVSFYNILWTRYLQVEFKMIYSNNENSVEKHVFTKNIFNLLYPFLVLDKRKRRKHHSYFHGKTFIPLRVISTCRFIKAH